MLSIAWANFKFPLRLDWKLQTFKASHAIEQSYFPHLSKSRKRRNFFAILLKVARRAPAKLCYRVSKFQSFSSAQLKVAIFLARGCSYGELISLTFGKDAKVAVYYNFSKYFILFWWASYRARASRSTLKVSIFYHHQTFPVEFRNVSHFQRKCLVPPHNKKNIVWKLIKVEPPGTLHFIGKHRLAQLWKFRFYTIIRL